jgi:predicted DNA-binding transcriptional regulator YafY
MFSEEEVEALVLGLRTLIQGPDRDMAATARDATAKIAAVLPPQRRDEMHAVGLFAVPRSTARHHGALADLRRAIREELQVRLRYRDRAGDTTERVIYPVALGYFQDHQVLVGWCTLRNDYRSFRIDGMLEVNLLERRLPEPRRTLFHRWRAARNLPDLA